MNQKFYTADYIFAATSKKTRRLLSICLLERHVTIGNIWLGHITLFCSKDGEDQETDYSFAFMDFVAMMTRDMFFHSLFITEATPTALRGSFYEQCGFRCIFRNRKIADREPVLQVFKKRYVLIKLLHEDVTERNENVEPCNAADDLSSALQLR